MHRFTPTPYAKDLRLMHRTVRLETNDPAVLDLSARFFERHQHGRSDSPQFLWRLVCEPDPLVQTAAVQLAAFSDPCLRYVNVDQRGFLIVDIERREASGFMGDLLVKDARQYRNSRALDILFCMTAPSLGLTALSGGCVGVDGRGVLVFGAPNSGKTTSCYLAAKRGMEFHADQTIFLDMDCGELHGWGDLFPAVFRRESLEFLPELKDATHHSTCGDFSFLYLDKEPFQPRQAAPVVPVCSLFLDRGTAGPPKLTEISPDDAMSRLHRCLLFREDERFDAQITKALTALGSRPAYSLHYDSDPKVVAAFIERMLR